MRFKDEWRSNNSEFVEVLSTFDPLLLSFARSLLDGEGIEYYIKGEHTSFIEPVEPVRLLVRKEDMETARDILKDLV